MSSSYYSLEPESVYIKTLQYSALLLTIALVFYHMTKFQTLEMNAVVSSSFSVIIIVISIIYLFVGNYSYFIRVSHLLNNNNDDDMMTTENNKIDIIDIIDIKYEKHNMILYFILGLILLCVQVAIAFFIIKGIRQK